METPYTGPQPPRLRPSTRPRRTRAWLWVLLGLVLALRLTVFREPPQWGGRQGPFFPQTHQGHRRPVTYVHPPEHEVPSDLWRLHIDVSPRDADVLRGYHWNGWRGNRGNEDRPEVSASLREGSTTYSNVALHLKGSAGSFRPFDDKPAMTLSVSKNVSGRRFHGYTKFSLNNSVQDPSYLSEAICRELFHEAGVPAPRAEHATVILNGKDLGLYVLTEGWGKPFLRRYFENVGGNLYDGGFLQDLTGNLDTNSGDDREDHSDLDRLLAAALDPDPASRWERLLQVLDMERFLSFIAMEVITGHWDGYAMNRNNYRVFHDRSTGRMVFMPHGMDQMFGTFKSSPESTILPSMEGLVARAVVNTSPGRERYLERVATLRSNVFLPDKVTARVRELSARIRPTLAAYGARDAAHHDAEVDHLCERIVRRARSISEQLEAQPKPLEFNGSGIAFPGGWTPRITSRQGGDPRLRRVEFGQRAALQISMENGGGAASWRTRVLLEPGRYHFAADAQTHEVSRGGGVCLRISGESNDALARPEKSWSEVSFGFEVHDALTEVELVAELRAAQGDAWFDADSLRLERR